MKTKTKYLLTIFFMIGVFVLFGTREFPRERDHQHLNNPQPADRVEENQDLFSTHLPILTVQTDDELPEPYRYTVDGRKKRNNATVSAAVNYYDLEGQDNTLEDAPTVEEKATFRIDGRSSRTFDKKSYVFEFKQDDLIESKKVGLSGMTPDSKWVLHGPYIDKTLIRNYLAYNLTGEIMTYSPNVRFTELFLNGDYQGLYLLTEKIGYNREGRIDITETNPELANTSYILAMDPGSDNDFYNLNTFNNYTGRSGLKNRTSQILEVVYPRTTLTAAQKSYIEEDISKFEKSLASFDSADRKLGYPAYINEESFVDYFVINEFMMNTDAGKFSTYFYKDFRGYLHAVVWDFKSIFNNYTPDHTDPHYFVMTDKTWFNLLVRDARFVERVIHRYYHLRETYLSDEYILNYIDDTVAYLGPAIERNYEVWGYSFETEYDFLLPSERNPRTHEEAVEQLKDMVVERGAYLDHNIEILRTLSHDSTNKIFRERSND